jgi:hypothetical protein
MYRLRTTWTGTPGAPLVSTHYFSSTVLQSSPTGCADALQDFWQTLHDRITNKLTWQVEPNVETIGEDGALQDMSSVGSSRQGIGGDTNTVLPFQVQGLIRWHTGDYNGGRELAGRTFVPGPTINSCVNGLPNSDYTGVLSNAAQGLIDDSDELVIWSRKRGDSKPVTAQSPWAKFADLRTRRD